jgi:hypothetical protein
MQALQLHQHQHQPPQTKDTASVSKEAASAKETAAMGKEGVAVGDVHATVRKAIKELVSQTCFEEADFERSHLSLLASMVSCRTPPTYVVEFCLTHTCHALSAA